MFNFASKVINTLGDLINVEEPPKPAANQQSQSQRRISGDGPFFQQPKARFHGPSSLSDHNAFREQTSILRDPPRSSAPVYRYPSTSGSSNHQQTLATPNYSVNSSSNYTFSDTKSYGQPSETNYPTPGGNQHRTGRYEDKYKPPDNDYNKDLYSINNNYDDGSFLPSDVQTDYDTFEDQRTDDRNMNQREEDRFMPTYDGNVENKLANRQTTHRESPQMRNTNECNEKNSSIYSNSTKLNYQMEDSWSNDRNSDIMSYDNTQYNSPRSMVMNLADDTQFTDPVDLNLWRQDYSTSQGWKTEENNTFENKDDKISPSPPSQDEDAKNSSRSESESSDEISFGEALATGLIPPHITPEIAARMNIELINHPKAVIESIYGHSPGEVYTIPEDEDEIYSPTGADGVTSLRKQRMASARMKTSNLLTGHKEFQNQQRRVVQNHQQYDDGNKLNYTNKYETGGDMKGDQNEQYCINGKNSKQVPMQRYTNASSFQPDQNISQTQSYYHHQLPQVPYESNMSYQPHRSPENKVQQDRQQSQKVSRQENRQINYQSDPKFPNQMSQQQFYNDHRPFQGSHNDGRPQQHPQQVGQMSTVDAHQKQQMPITSENKLLPHEQTNRNQSYQSGFIPNTGPVVTGLGYDDNRVPQSAPYCDNRLPQSVQLSDNRQIISNDSCLVQKVQVGNNFQTHPLQPLQPPQQPQSQSYYNTSQPSQQYVEQYQPLQQQQQTQSQQYLHQSLPYQPSGTADNRQNQFFYPNTDPRTDVSDFQCQPSQNFSNQQQQQQQQITNNNRSLQSNFPQQNQQQQPTNDNRSLHSNFPPQIHQQQQRPNFSQSNESWSNQQGMNYYGPNYPPPFPPQNVSLKGQPYPADPRSLQYYDDRPNYLAQDSRKSNFQPTSQPPPQSLNQQCYQYDYTHPGCLPPQEFNQPDQRVSQIPRRSLPSDSDIGSLPIHDRRKRLPLRKFYSEERDGGFYEDFDRSGRRNSQTFDNVHRDGEGSSRLHHDQQMRHGKSRQRSSSLDSQHERMGQYVKSRSCSLERNRDMVAEEYEKENRRRTLSRTHSQCDEYSHEERRKHMQRVASLGHSSAHTRRVDAIEKASRSDTAQEKHRTSLKEMKTAVESRQQTQKVHHQSSLPPNNSSKKIGNYCLQHKKFTPVDNSSVKSSRRHLPKEPAVSLSGRRKLGNERNSHKGDENAQQRAGILSTATRKSERGTNLKISFSEPISNLLNPKNRLLATTSDNRRESHLSKSISLGEDKNLASNSKLVTTQHICPFTRESTNVILNQVPPLHRNQSLDSQFRDSHLAVSPNARSHPIPIVTRTRSLDRYSSSDTNLNTSPYYHDHFSRPGSAPGLMYEPVHPQSSNSAALQMSIYEMHAKKKEDKFWSDIYSALPADMKHLITNRGSLRNKLPMPPTTHQIAAERPSSSASSLEQRLTHRGVAVKGNGKCSRDASNSSLGERIGNRLRMLHEMKEQSKVMFNRRKPATVLTRRSASDGEYSFSSTTNFPLYWNLQRRPHSDSAIDLLERLETPNPQPRISGSAYNSSEYLTTNPCLRVVDKSQSYLTSPSTNVPPSPAPTQPIKLRDTALRGDRIESVSYPTVDNRAGFFSCLQNIESLTRQYQEDFLQDEDEIYSDSGIPHSEYARYDIHEGGRRNKPYCPPIRGRHDHFDNV